MSKSKKEWMEIISIVIISLFVGFYTGASISSNQSELVELNIKFDILQDKYEELQFNSSNAINELNISYEQLNQKYSVLKQEYYYLESERNTLLLWLQDAKINTTQLKNRIKELEDIISLYENNQHS